MSTETPGGLRKWSVRLMKIMAVAVVVFIAAVVMVSLLIDWYCIAQPPERPAVAPIREMVVVEVDGVRSIGKGKLGERNGVMWMHLQGDPYTLGYMNAALTGPWISQQETELLETVREMVPGWWRQFLLWKLVQLRNRDLPSYVSLDEQLEILGLADGHADPHPELAFWAPLYYRILNYHVAHDLAHAVIDSPLLVDNRFLAGCTSFAAWGEATKDGGLIIGRNFDFDAARAFDLNKIVTRVEQDEMIPFTHVAWPGMAGAVTGINDEQIIIALNGVRSDDRLQIGTPICFVVRQALQRATTLDEAIDIIRNATVFVSDLYLVADGKTNEVAVVEKTPEQTHVRYPVQGEHVLIVSNHFMTDPMAEDVENQHAMASGTTVQRYDRMRQLVERKQGAIDIETAVQILRDRRGVDDLELGPGNEASLNPLIATHSVIFDLAEGVIYVAASPHQLGNYVPFHVSDVSAIPDQSVLPADMLMEDGSYERLRLWREKLRAGQRAFRQGNTRQARSLLHEAAALNLKDYQSRMLLGQLAFTAGDQLQAQIWLEESLSLYPAFLAERERIQKMLDEIATSSLKQ